MLCAFCNPSHASDTAIAYTKIESCVEQVENDNAAFSHLQCPNIGLYSLNITAQNLQYFKVLLMREGKTVSSELNEFSRDLPMQPGKAIEWHLYDSAPTLMVFRIFILPDNQQPQEQLTLSFVTPTRICPVASIDAATNINANEKMRALIARRYSNLEQCPKEIDHF